jgi:hypothetical protein
MNRAQDVNICDIKNVDELDPLNIKARYPDYKDRLSQQLTHSVCEGILKQTKSLPQWTKETILSGK